MKLTLIVLSPISADGTDTHVRSHRWWLDNVFAEASFAVEGHPRRRSVQCDAVGGLSTTADGHLDAASQRKNLGCPVDCSATYRFATAAIPRYHFVVQNEEETRDWIAIDRVVRERVLVWFHEL